MSQAIFAVLLQFLISFALAAPTEIHTSAEGWQTGAGGGVIGFIVLILDIIVWYEVIQSDRPTSHKLLWSLLVFIFPIGGIIIYWLFSNRAAHKQGYEPVG